MKFLNLKVITLLVISMFIVGCGGSNSAASNDEEQTPVENTTIALVINEEVEVFSNDTIDPLSEDTEYQVRHILDTDKKYITLTSGSANLIRTASAD